MNQTGVTSTGSRLHALRNRLTGERLVADRLIEQFARQRHQLFEPERLVAKLRPELPDLVRLRIVEIVVAGDDGDRRGGQSRDGADGAKELQPARQWHPQIEDHGLRAMRL